MLGLTDNPSTNKIKYKKSTVIKVTDKEIEISEDEFKVFEEIRKYPVMVNDLAKNPKKNTKALIAAWEGIKKALDKLEE